MSLLRKLMVPTFVLASTFHVYAQIKNAETITAKVSGNCGMCEATIEKAGTVKKEAKVEWDKDAQIATITYDPQKTGSEQVLKRIALAGYDNEKFLAPEEAYNNLHGCCQYVRVDVPTQADKSQAHGTHSADAPKHENHNGTEADTVQSDALAPVFKGYFNLQEALVKSDRSQAATIADELQNAIGNVKMTELKADEHAAWMQVMDKLSATAKGIADATELKKQRTLFADLSEQIYGLAKAAEQSQPMYFNNCPMFNDGKGANWLSEAKIIRNPYYGSEMLSCGKTIETIK